MWTEIIVAVLSSSAVAAAVTSICNEIVAGKQRREEKASKEDNQNKALRYIMLYIIQERAKELIRDGSVTLDERRSLHHWHDLYHNGLGGNGDADALMAQVDKLPVRVEE